MSERIRVVIVDDIPETREHLAKLLSFEPDMEVVGTGGSGPEALEVTGRLRPDVVLMDVNMPGFDGITAAEQLSVVAPGTSIVMMSVQGESDYLRRSMLAGAREFLVKPFSSDELCAAIRQVHQREREKVVRAPAVTSAVVPAGGREPGKVVSVFSPKGGVGRTTIAVNLAVALASGYGRSVALVDACLQFGDVGVLLNLDPRTRSVMDVLGDAPGGNDEAIDAALVSHTAGVRVMLAPPSPEMAELVTVDHFRRVIQRLRETHDHVIIDCPPIFQDHTLAVLDISDLILGVLTLEITSIKNVRLFLDLARQLGYPEDRVRLVLNRADSAYGIRVADVEGSIGRRIDHTVVSDGRKVVYALNRGVPFVWSAQQAQVSQDIVAIAKAMVEGPAQAADATAESQAGQRKGIFARRS